MRPVPSRQHGENHGDERHQIQTGARRMRVFPLPAKLRPILRQHRPVVRDLIGRVSVCPKDDLSSRDAKKGDEREKKSLPLFANRKA